MGRINILKPNIYNLISAGEVVERPASVVKELVENSIDAGATEIDVAIENGGISLIRISDNGIGIDAEDFHAVFMPHATSKLKDATDLDTIATLGFRGEALASISAVSEVCLVSKTQNAEFASSLTVKGGEYEEIQYVAGKKGTTIEVRNLFFNTPARIKFLKKPKSEERMVVTKMQELILANSEISFSLSIDGKLLYSTNGETLLSALHSIYDRATMRELVPFATSRGAFSIEGYFSKPTYSKANRTYQTIIINGRVVNCVTIATAVQRAYAPYLMKRSFPMFVLSLVMPFDLVDVNVHPAKSEVRFVDNNAVFGFVFSAMREMLDNLSGQMKTMGENFVSKEVEQTNFSSIDITNANQNILDEQSIKIKAENRKGNRLNSEYINSEYINTENINSEIINSENINSDCKDEILNDATSKMRDTYDFANSSKPNDMSSIITLTKRKSVPTSFNDNAVSFNPYFSKTDFYKTNIQVNEHNFEDSNSSNNKLHYSSWMESYKVVGQLFDTYIILQNENEAYIIDQHAAHERILFDKLMCNLDNAYSQPMLFPYEVKLNGEEFEFFRDIASSLTRLGFEIELFDCENKFEFRAIPLVLIDMEIDVFLKHILSDLGEQKEVKLDELLINKLAQIACKSAIKGGDTLNPEQLDYILDVFFGNNKSLPTQCPHGRPAVIKMTKLEIEKMFKRKL